MSRYVCVLTALLGGLATAAAAQASDTPPPKQVRAIRLSGGAGITVDGKLDEDAWSQAQWIRDFVQKRPREGAPPTDSMRIAILYDDDAIYVGARMYSRDPSKIQAPLSRRDNTFQAERIWVSFDSYHDKRTAYSFGVSASGVRADWYHASDNENDANFGFDPVWEAKANIDALGWTAEMRIPFSQLRFTNQAVQVWGFNANRWNPVTSEDDYWIPVPTDRTGWSSFMGQLVGIEGIKPTRRLELMPYGAADTRFQSGVPAGDPFNGGANLAGRAGADLKMGLGPNITLDGTVNPDFGQVEADPAVVNLSAFEVFFDEKRPFFTEGNQLLRGSGPSYFYSRRIGARPACNASGDFVDCPHNATILGAAKVTGRLATGMSLGALAAVTSRESARTYDTATATLRGDASDINRVQTSAVHYFQRPDAHYLTYDSTLTAFTGSIGSLWFSKTKGNWLADIQYTWESPAYDPNDVGRLSNADSRAGFVGVQYRQTHPRAWFQNYNAALSTYTEYDFGGDRQVLFSELWGEVVLKNFWDLSSYFDYQPRAFDHSATRGGPEMATPERWNWVVRLASKFGAQNAWNGRVYYGEDELGGQTYRLSGGLTLQPSTRFQVSATPNYLRAISPRQYVTTFTGTGSAATYGSRYVFARIDQSTFLMQLRANYTIGPDLTLELYGEPFAASGRYYGLGELAAARTFNLREYGTSGTTIARDAAGDYTITDNGGTDTLRISNPDFNILSFRSNAVLRWEWRPGSTLYLVWAQSKFGFEPTARLVGFGDLADSFSARGDNFFAVKVSYWIPVN